MTSTHTVNKTHILNDCLVGIEAVLLRCVDVSPEKHTYVHIYTQGNIYVQHDYLRTDLFLQSSLAITFEGLRAGYPFSKRKSKKGGSQKGSHPVPNLAGHGVMS